MGPQPDMDTIALPSVQPPHLRVYRFAHIFTIDLDGSLFLLRISKSLASFRSLKMSKVCKLLSGTPETKKNVVVADRQTAFVRVRFCLATSMDPSIMVKQNTHYRNNCSCPLRRYFPIPLLLLHIPAVNHKIAPDNIDIWT